MSNKKLLALVIMSGIVTEVLDIVINENPEIVIRAISQVVEKNPEIFNDIFKAMNERKTKEKETK